MSRMSLPAIAGLLALLLAACGGSPESESPSASEVEAAPSVEATPEPAASEPAEPSEAAEPSDAEGGSGGSGSELADMLPDTLGGVMRQDIDLDNPMFAAALAEQGVDPSEVDFLIASYGSVGVTAIRIPELEQPQLEQLARLMAGMPETEGSVETVTVGGKSVLAMTATEVGQTGYMYFSDGAVFVIGGGSEEQAAEILEQLP